MRSNTDNEEIYCICKKPDDGQGMVQCDVCLEWLHYDCIDIKYQHKKRIYSDDFNCPICANTEKHSDDFHCPICAYNCQCKNNLNDVVEDAQNVNELISILETIPLSALKSLISEQIKNDTIDISISRRLKCQSMNYTLPKVLIQSIISFDGNRNKHRTVCKQWNELSDIVDKNELKEKYKSIKQQQLEYDEEETYLMSEIRKLKTKQYKKLHELDQAIQAYKANKIQIKSKYNKMIKELEKLSHHQCKKCGAGGYDNILLVKCTSCKKELCGDCMLRCKAGDGNECESKEYYCCDDCDKRGICAGCDRALCRGYCFEREECEYCQEKICESCIRGIDKYEEWGSSPWDNRYITVGLCQSCYEMEKCHSD